MPRFLIALVLIVLCSVVGGADPVPPTTPRASDGWDEVVADLRQSSAELGENDRILADLMAKNEQLQALGKSSSAEIAQLQTLVDAHAQRVKDLGDRYGKVLVLAQKLKKDAERAAVLNYVFGGIALVAVAAAAGEGFALAHR